MTSEILAQRTDAVVAALTARPRRSGPAVVNDIHSQLNATRVHRVVDVRELGGARQAVLAAGEEGRSICIGGGWHAMGGQQFAEDGVLLDTRRFNQVLAFDRERGTVEVEAGIQWPELVARLNALQDDDAAVGLRFPRWAIAQKQTGADRLSIGGALSANVHGRGLAMRPFVGDIESFTLLDGAGRTLRCAQPSTSPASTSSTTGSFPMRSSRARRSANTIKARRASHSGTRRRTRMWRVW